MDEKTKTNDQNQQNETRNKEQQLKNHLCKIGTVEQPIAMDTVFMGMDKDGNDMYYNKVTGKTTTVPHT